MKQNPKIVILDEKDHLILGELKKNGKLSSQQLSKRTRLPISTIHNRIKKLRQEVGITQTQLAFEAGISLSQIARIETARIPGSFFIYGS